MEEGRERKHSTATKAALAPIVGRHMTMSAADVSTFVATLALRRIRTTTVGIYGTELLQPITRQEHYLSLSAEQSGLGGDIHSLEEKPSFSIHRKGNSAGRSIGSLKIMGKGAPAQALEDMSDDEGAGRGGLKGFKCGSLGHKSGDCPKAKQKRKGKQTCNLCGKAGHVRRECPGFEDNGAGQSKFKDMKSGSRKAHKDRGSKGSQGEKREETPPLPVTEVPFIDAHCHLLQLLDQVPLPQGSLHRLVEAAAEVAAGDAPPPKGKPSRLAAMARTLPFPENFRGCIASVVGIEELDRADDGAMDAQLAGDDVWVVVGISPHQAARLTSEQADRYVTRLRPLGALADHRRCVGIGETGLDFTDAGLGVNPADGEDVREAAKSRQRVAFEALARAAAERQKTIVVRAAGGPEVVVEVGDTLSRLLPPSEWRVHLRCAGLPACMETVELVKRFPGLHIGFSGQVTFSKAKETQEVAFDCPLDRCLLESDAPWQVPSTLGGVGGREEICLPAHLPAVAEKLAGIKGVELERVMEAAWSGVQSCYRISLPEEEGAVGSGSEKGEE
mmetsp:Transcript_54394/g.172813  ORF Transcript_54394/g.172813 Transcript_54394/m.172813 type:complete len:560 (-) Transcript_54394:292-1971(-)